mmetsp:Transcript_14505/g.24025  ORF Transcript_14505/g.24025 Transcript_14505/m.24025 type:complete len:168 (+) Transcript_14505:77-580(+)
MMKTFLLIATATVALFAVTASAFNPAAVTTRRAGMLSTASAAAALLLGGGEPAVAVVDGGKFSPFLGGTFTDPINHPGGTRTIEMTGTSFAGYSLATVKGGGGKGEPESYELPAMIFDCPGRRTQTGQYCISIDFSPKGGPEDFQGYWDEEKKGIRFVLDNNFWPMQ